MAYRIKSQTLNSQQTLQQTYKKFLAKFSPQKGLSETRFAPNLSTSAKSQSLLLKGSHLYEAFKYLTSHFVIKTSSFYYLKSRNSLHFALCPLNSRFIPKNLFKLLLHFTPVSEIHWKCNEKNASLTKCLLKRLPLFTNLKALSLQCFQFNHTIPEPHFENLSSLIEINLEILERQSEENYINSIVLRNVGKIITLRKLKLSILHENVEPVDLLRTKPIKFEELRTLQELNVFMLKVTKLDLLRIPEIDSLVALLNQLPKLEIFDFDAHKSENSSQYENNYARVLALIESLYGVNPKFVKGLKVDFNQAPYELFYNNPQGLKALRNINWSRFSSLQSLGIKLDLRESFIDMIDSVVGKVDFPESLVKLQLTLKIGEEKRRNAITEKNKFRRIFNNIRKLAKLQILQIKVESTYFKDEDVEYLSGVIREFKDLRQLESDFVTEAVKSEVVCGLAEGLRKTDHLQGLTLSCSDELGTIEKLWNNLNAETDPLKRNLRKLKLWVNHLFTKPEMHALQRKLEQFENLESLSLSLFPERNTLTTRDLDFGFSKMKRLRFFEYIQIVEAPDDEMYRSVKINLQRSFTKSQHQDMRNFRIQGSHYIGKDEEQVGAFFSDTVTPGLVRDLIINSD